MAKSLQDILKRRQQGEFVGREEQLSFFHRNLRWEIDDPRRRFIINVSGQGGVGKTWLLCRFHKIAEEFAAVTAYTDETEEDIPGVMSRVAGQCAAQEHPLKTLPGPATSRRPRASVWQPPVHDRSASAR
jgi:hypothetical protein